jgi:hypothetical protein
MTKAMYASAVPAAKEQYDSPECADCGYLSEVTISCRGYRVENVKEDYAHQQKQPRITWFGGGIENFLLGLVQKV